MEIPVGILHSPLCMVLFALAVRVLYIIVAHSYRLRLYPWHFFEMANLARSLATGHGFSSPYQVNTGPSALAAPLYPWVVSLAFRAFGVFSEGAGFAMLVFNSVFSALTCWTIYRVARRVFNPTVAVWSGWIWAVWPYAIYYSVDWIWETTLSAFLMSLLLMLTLEMEGDGHLSSWFSYALVWGTAALTNTAELAWLPFSGCWLAWQLHRRGRPFLAPVAFGAAVFWMILTPWMVRNYRVFGELVFIRGNFGNELRAANNPLADGGRVPRYDAGRDPLLLTVWMQIGERAINAQQAEDAQTWIAQHPKRFLELCGRRVILFWAGFPRAGLERLTRLLYQLSSLLAIGGLALALRRRVHGVFLMATLLAFYPLTYYITVPESRYRHAIEPELLMLSVFLLWFLAARVRSGCQSKDEVLG